MPWAVKSNFKTGLFTYLSLEINHQIGDHFFLNLDSEENRPERKGKPEQKFDVAFVWNNL
jgi:hypothetical protein